MGTYFDVQVDKYTLETSVTEALEHGVSALCTNSDRAAGFMEAAHNRGSAYRAGAIVGPVNGTLTPAMFASGEELPEGYRWVRDRWHEWIEDIGATLENVWYDGNHEHYGSNNRSVEIVSVPAGFRMWTVTVNGWGTPPKPHGVGPATDVAVDAESFVVHPGEYLVGEERAAYAASTAPDVVAYLGPSNGWDEWRMGANYSPMGSRESVFYALAESEGWDTSRCYARCDACNGAWLAEGGWTFRHFDGPQVEDFDYDDTTDHDGSSVACPACSAPDEDGEPTGTGRVFFDIF